MSETSLPAFCRIGGPEHPFYAQFRALCAETFAPRDRRDERQQSVAFSLPGYRLEYGEADGRLLFFLSYYLFDDYYYLEHFAVRPDLRGRGLGGRVLLALLERNPERRLVLELDPFPADEGRRRVAFYERLGLALNPEGVARKSFLKGDRLVFLRIMSQGRPLSGPEFAGLKDDLENTIERSVWPE